jgi:hypothetical protein
MKIKASQSLAGGAPAAIRTRGLRIRNPSLYPSELQGRKCWSERAIRLTRFAAGVNIRCPSCLSDLIDSPGGELDAGQAAAINRPRVDPDLVSFDQRLGKGRVAEHDGLAEIPPCIDELGTDPEEVLRRLLGDGNARSESRVDKEEFFRFMTDGKRDKKTQVVLRKSDPRPHVGEGEAVGIQGAPAAVEKKKLLILPSQVIVEEHRFVVSLEADQIRTALFEVEERIDHPSRIRAAIEIIAEEDEGIFARVDSDPVKKPIQQVVAAVDVADSQYPARHSSPVQRPIRGFG